jgi:hypothetical protein
VKNNGDDVNLCSFEFMNWLDAQPELDVVCKNSGPWKIVLLKDHVYMVKTSMWELILTINSKELS